MKLRNKLLPLIGLSTVAAIVSPIAFTSCSDQSFVQCDITKYTKSTEQIEREKFDTKDEAAVFYRDELLKKPSIFMDDLKAWQLDVMDEAKQEYPTIEKWEMGVPNSIGINTVDIWVGGTQWIFPTLTFNFTLDKDVKYLITDAGGVTHNMRQQIKASFSYKNFPFTVRNVDLGAAEKWHVSALIADTDNWDYEKLMFVPNWSYSFISETVQTDEYQDQQSGETVSITSNRSRVASISSYSQFVTLLEEYLSSNPGKSNADFIKDYGIVDFNSNYLEKVKHD